MRRADVEFFRGKFQLTAAQQSTADRVEARFRGLNGDQLRKRVFLTHVRGGPAMRVGDGVGAVNVMIELISCCLFLSSSPPPATFGVWRLTLLMADGSCGHSIKRQQLRGTWLPWRACVRAEEYA